MNGYPNPTNGNYQYQTSNIQSQIYPPNAQNVNYSSDYCNSNYVGQNIISPPGIKSSVYGSLPPISGGTLSYNNDIKQNCDVGIPPNYGYIDQTLTTQSDIIANNYDQRNVGSQMPRSDTLQKSFIPPLPQQNLPYMSQPQGTYQSHNSQIPNALTEQVKNLQLHSSLPETTIDLMQMRNVFSDNVQSNTPKTIFSTNCDEDVMQCTLNTLPVEASMLSKSRLPLGLHIQPFRDTDIMLVQTNTIVRCRSCRTYINPFVSLTDHQRRWHCNVCGRVNDLPDEFMYDPITKTYGSPTKRPELQYSSIEYTANPDYTVRPPMAPMYVFCLDVSQAAVNSGYLRYTCELLIENLEKIPGNSRKQIAFLTYDSNLYYYQIQENSFKAIVWSDISEVDLPVSEDLLVSINDRKEIILEFLHNLPLLFETSVDNGNCMGYAIQVAMKLITHNGGRITVINASIPNKGPGNLTVREGQESESKLIQPATDFYKTLALQCANDQISVDLFCINREYSDIASFATISRHSAGGFHYYGNFKAVINENKRWESIEQLDFDRFTKDFKRYLTRKIGFEAVMRTRFSKGLDLTNFLGNLFMRSTNVIAIPVVNPDASYAIQFKINSSLSEWNYVVIQSALLYTTSDSDRRIRVHTMCIPLSDKIEQVFQNANSRAIAGLIAKIAVDKCITDGLSNVREAFVNSLVDPLKIYNSMVNQGRGSQTLFCPYNLRHLVPYILGLLRISAFREKLHSTDDRVAMLESLRSLPLTDILHRLYPQMVSVHQLAENLPLKALVADASADDDDKFIQPPVLNLSSASISREGAFLMDVGECFYLFLGNSISSSFLKYGFGIDNISQIPKEGLVTNFDLSNIVCRRMLKTHKNLSGGRFLGTSVITVLPDCSLRGRILNHLVEDRMENSMSYYEFLKSVQSSVHS